MQKIKRNYYVLDASNDTPDLEKKILSIIKNKLKNRMENKLENPYFSTRLFGLNNYLEDLINTFENKFFPSTSLIIGKKVLKFTLINHFLNYIFDKSYDREKCMINLNSDFSKKYLAAHFQI